MLVDVVGVGAVVGDRGLDQAERHFQVARGLGCVAVVVADYGDDLPDVLAGPDEAGAAAGRAVGEPDQRVLVHSQALFDIALRQRPWGEVHAPGTDAQAPDRGVIEADAQRQA